MVSCQFVCPLFYAPIVTIHWHIVCSLNYDDLVCNNFYDMWGEFKEATNSEQTFPTLTALQRLGSSANGNREVMGLPTTASKCCFTPISCMRCLKAQALAYVGAYTNVMQVLVVHHDDDAGLLALDEAAVEAVGNASARGAAAGIQVRIPLAC